MSNPIRMAGPPRRIYLLDPIDIGAQSVKLISKQRFGQFCENDELPCRTRAKAGGQLNLKLRLSNDTEPGVYNAQLDVGSKHYDVLMEVQPSAKLRFLPKSLMLTAKPGGTIKANLAIYNCGNVGINVPNSAIANIYQLQSLPSAFANTFQLETEDASELAKSFLINLKNGYGGVMKFHFDGNLCEISPNTQEVFQIKGRVPKLAKSGCIYTGIMHIVRFHALFEITVL